MVGAAGSDEDVLVAEQIAYYRARAAEFDRPYAERADLQELLAVADALPIVGGDAEPEDLRATARKGVGRRTGLR